MKKTTIEIDTDVIAEVQAILGTKGIKDTVDAALLRVRREEAWRRHSEWLREVGPDILSPEAARWRDDLD